MKTNNTIIPIGELYALINKGNKDIAESKFKDRILKDVSFSSKLTIDKNYNNVSMSDKKSSYNLTIYLDNKTIENALRESENSSNENKYDVVIDGVFTTKKFSICVAGKSLIRVGISSREERKKRLQEYYISKGYKKREKRLPALVTSVLAITSKYGNVEDDISKNIGISRDKIRLFKCQTSKEIALGIRGARGGESIIVLFRGGHEDDAMDIFSSEEIIDAIHVSKKCICVALGHEQDNPFIYSVADQKFSTPSSFAKEISAHNKTFLNDSRSVRKDFKNMIHSLKEKLLVRIGKEEDGFMMLYAKAESNYSERLLKTKHSKNNRKKNIIIGVLVLAVLALLIKYFV